MPVRSLRLRLLGRFEVEGIDRHEVGSRKARTLLKILALSRGAPVAADVLAEHLWGDAQPTRPADQIGVLVSRLRAVLGAERLVRVDGGYALRADWVDATELEFRVEEARQRFTAGAYAAARSAARAAIDLAQGPLLPDDDAEWLMVERAAVDRLVSQARLLAADAALAAGDAATASADAEAALDHDPYDEASLRTAMTAFLRAGRRGSALACYARVRRRLRDDLGVSPGPETEAIYQLALVEGDTAGGSNPDPAVPSADLVGRGEEMRTLLAILEGVRAGGSNGVDLEGEAGIGKTALVGRLAERARSGGAAVLVGRCDELGRDLPLQPILDALDTHLQAIGPEAAGQLLAPDLVALGPVLGRSGSAPSAAATPPSDTTSVAEPGSGRAILFGTLLGVVRRLTVSSPVLIVIEDVHLAGDSTIEWCRMAARRCARLMIVTTRRPDGRAVFGDQPASHITLGPLDQDAVFLLVGADRGPGLLRRSGGNPLFLVELAAAGNDSMPDSIKSAVQDRVRALGPEVATTIQAAAVLGQDVDVGLVAAVTGTPVPALLGHVESAVAARVLQERGASFAFAHDLLREALEAAASAGRRAFLHKNAAETLAGRPGADPLSVAWHARAAGEPVLASDALVSAARTAVERFDYAAAERLLDEAIALNQSASAYLARGRVRMAHWAVPGAAEDASLALMLGGGVEAMELAGWVAYYQRDYEAAGRLADEALERAGDDGLRSSCLSLAGRVRHSRGDLAEADARLDEAVRIGTPQVRGVAQIWRGALLSYRGRPTEAFDLVDRALFDPGRLSHPFAMLHGCFTQARILGMQGRPVEALAALDRLDQAVQRSGLQGVRFQAVADNTRSWVIRNLGDHDAADDGNEQALSASLDVAQMEPHHAAALDLADGRLLNGDLDSARDRLGAAAAVLAHQGTMAWHQRDRYRLLSARLALATDDYELAMNSAAELVDNAGGRGEARYRALGEFVLAAARGRTGKSVDHDALKPALADLDRLAAMESWRSCAEVAAATGHHPWWEAAEARLGRLVNASGGADVARGLESWGNDYLHRLRSGR